MSSELYLRLFESLGFILLYLVVGFGPGFIIGIILGNLTGGRGREHQFTKHDKAIKAAAEHNAQWHPTHQRWQKNKK